MQISPAAYHQEIHQTQTLAGRVLLFQTKKARNVSEEPVRLLGVRRRLLEVRWRLLGVRWRLLGFAGNLKVGWRLLPGMPGMRGVVLCTRAVPVAGLCRECRVVAIVVAGGRAPG